MRLEDYLSTHAEKRRFAAGTPVFIQGQQAAAAYYIIAGAVEIYRGSGAKGSVMAELGADEIFGEMALLRFDEYTLSARAVRDTEVYVITPEMLHEQMRQTHPMVRAIMDMLLERIHNVNQVLIDIDTLQQS